MVTPALVIDGDVKVAGKVPSVENIKKWITVSELLNKQERKIKAEETKS